MLTHRDSYPSFDLGRTVTGALLALFALLGGAASAGAQQTFADWTHSMASTAAFQLGSTTATVAITNPVNWAGSFSSIVTADGATNYPSTWYTPTPDVGAEWLESQVANASSSGVGTADWVITFASPVVDPRFHFLNLDNATLDFGPTTDTSGNPVVLTRLSGNPEFEVTGNVVNSTPNPALALGCEDAGGGNPNGACGTIELTGAYTTVVVSTTDTSLDLGTADGFVWTVSVALPAPIADLSVFKEASPATVSPGDSLFYTVTVTNNSPSVAVPDAVVTDTLPAGVTLVSTIGCAEDPVGIPTCTLGKVAPLGRATFLIEVVVDAGSGMLTNTATVSSEATNDSDPGNDSSSANTQIGSVIDVPTVSEWGLGLLALLLAITALAVLRRR